MFHHPSLILLQNDKRGTFTRKSASSRLICVCSPTKYKLSDHVESKNIAYQFQRHEIAISGSHMNLDGVDPNSYHQITYIICKLRKD